MKIPHAGAWALALLLACLASPGVALAQHATSSAAPAGYAPEHVAITVPATSTPATNTAITTATTLAFTPQLGRPIRVILKLVSGSSFDAQEFTSPDNCSTLNQITVAGQVWGKFTGQTSTINEDVDTPMLDGIKYCLVVTPAAGATVSGGHRQ